MATTLQKRGFLRDFKREAAAKNKPLNTALQEILHCPTLSVQRGRILLNASSGDVTAGYSQSVGLNQAEVLETVAELLDLYDDVVAKLTTEGPVTDELAYQAMMAALRPIKGYTDNFVFLIK